MKFEIKARNHQENTLGDVITHSLTSAWQGRTQLKDKGTVRVFTAYISLRFKMTIFQITPVRKMSKISKYANSQK